MNPYQYVVLRCVPRADREEFLNVGVVVYCQATDFLQAAWSVDRERLAWCRRTGRPDRRVRQALADQVARTRALYRSAEPGIALLAPRSRPCVRTAFTLYGEILDRVVESGYDVFRRRVAVSGPRRFGVAAAAVGAVVAVSFRTPH